MRDPSCLPAFPALPATSRTRDSLCCSAFLSSRGADCSSVVSVAEASSVEASRAGAFFLAFFFLPVFFLPAFLFEDFFLDVFL